jgi:hypothetical protein
MASDMNPVNRESRVKPPTESRLRIMASCRKARLKSGLFSFVRPSGQGWVHS